MRKWRKDQLVPDLLFSDVNMPGLSGLELLEKLRPKMSGTFYVVMSGESDNQDPAMELGANYFLSKPLVAKEVRGVLQQIS